MMDFGGHLMGGSRGRAGIGVAIVMLGGCFLLAWGQAEPASQPADRKPLPRKSTVVRVRSDLVVTDRRVRENVLQEMFEHGFVKLTDSATIQEAWGKIIRPSERIGIKLDPFGEAELNTSLAMTKILLKSLVDSGYSADQIILCDAPSEISEFYQTKPLVFGWTEQPVDFASGQDELSSFVDQVDVIINVAFLKTDNILGLNGAVKNLTYHMVKHPARYHTQAGSPQLADILALPQIQNKIRLNILNALRVVFDQGPLVKPDFVDEAGLLMLSSDPVALDAVGLDEMNAIREKYSLTPIPINAERVPVLIDAANRGLGHIDFRKIERHSIAEF